ncbi:methyltransferase domain-containing protein [Candidatus Woesearchaeota archaeon]|nr:methyltransferase domain-containing protein [Candidatus Woesearchaeota archaeon]
MDKVNKILIRNEHIFYWKSKDLHTHSGIIKEEQIKKAKDGDILKASSGKEFTIISADFLDRIKRIKRGSQALLQKDIGLIIAKTGVNRDSIVVDAGTGSGMLASFLANVVKKVYTYEINESNLEMAKENFSSLELNNIELKNKNITEGIDEKEVDLITLDLSNPELVLEYAYNSLKFGGYLVCYCPQITQIMAVVENNKKFTVQEVTELLERHWAVDGRKVRPKSPMVAHSAFLIFLRKI